MGSKWFTVKLLDTVIINPFEASLKERVGFSDDNRPNEEIVTKVTIDRIGFSVITTPTTKRPQYAKLYDSLVKYITHIEEEHQRIGRLKDISIIDSEPFILIDLLFDKIMSLREDAMEGKEGVTQTIDIDPKTVPNDVIGATAIAVDVSRFAKVEAEGSGRLYVMAKNIRKAHQDNINNFETLLKMRTGFSKENLPSRTEESVITDIPSYLFIVTAIPTTTTKFNEIIKGLIHETDSGKVTKKTGLLIKAMNNPKDPEVEDIVRVKDGKIFVSIRGLRNSLDTLRKKNTEKGLKFEILPLHDPSY